MKSLTILSSFGFWLESSLHFCLSILRMANCKISPIYSTAWKLICCSRYFKAFSGLLLFRRRNAFLFVDKSVSFKSNSSTSSSISPITSDPKFAKTLNKQTTEFLLTYDDLCSRFLVIADAKGYITPLCIILEINLRVLPLKYSLWQRRSFLKELQARKIYSFKFLSVGDLHF